MGDRLLVVLPVSPWSERARWALDHHRLGYTKVVHQVFLGEARWRLRRQAGDTGGARATTPLLIEDGVLYGSSTAIARRADAVGAGAAAPLFPAGQDSAMERWVDNAEEGSHAFRLLIARRLLDSPLALDEQLPRAVPDVLRPLLRPITRGGTRWFARKYDLAVFDDDALAAAEARACACLERVRAGLQSSPRVGADAARYLLGVFSWADIVSCLLLQAVRPVQHSQYPLRPATRRQWEAPHLVDRFADLLQWRDDLYARHR